MKLFLLIAKSLNTKTFSLYKQTHICSFLYIPYLRYIDVRLQNSSAPHAYFAETTTASRSYVCISSCELAQLLLSYFDHYLAVTSRIHNSYLNVLILWVSLFFLGVLAYLLACVAACSDVRWIGFAWWHSFWPRRSWGSSSRSCMPRGYFSDSKGFPNNRDFDDKHVGLRRVSRDP